MSLFSSSSTALLATVPAVLVTGLALWYNYYHCQYWRKKEKPHPQIPLVRSKVVFFPDEATARSFSRQSQKESVEEGPGSLSVLIQTLQEAKKSLDVCVFVISCKELADVLVNAHRNGIMVRVISDGEQMTVSGSQIERLRKVGIQVRNDSTSYFMHHKFAVVDDRVLASGSLNWTLQGVCGNQENVVITDSPDMVAPFSRQFEKLWDMYDPENVEYYVTN